MNFRNFDLDQKQIKTLRNLRDRYMILQPDKGKGKILSDKTGYFQSLDRLMIKQCLRF